MNYRGINKHNCKSALSAGGLSKITAVNRQVVQGSYFTKGLRTLHTKLQKMQLSSLHTTIAHFTTAMIFQKY